MKTTSDFTNESQSSDNITFISCVDHALREYNGLCRLDELLAESPASELQTRRELDNRIIDGEVTIFAVNDHIMVKQLD